MIDRQTGWHFKFTAPAPLIRAKHRFISEKKTVFLKPLSFMLRVDEKSLVKRKLFTTLEKSLWSSVLTYLLTWIISGSELGT